MTESRQSYIDQYAEYAMEQMRRYGIPASITLAQGIIESGDGKSKLALTANNYFGVKGTFNGAYVLANDDKANEKFKKYDNVDQSFEDHSKVLMADRYQKYTKGLSPDDYKGWAAAIKAGGYATDKSYVNTIVSVIEGSNLQKYDQMVMQEMRAQGKSFGTVQNPLTVAASRGESVADPIHAAESAAGTMYSFPLKCDEFLLVTSPFGERNDPIKSGNKQFHYGIDILTKHDTVLATENYGKVVTVNLNENTGEGKTVTIEYSHHNGSKHQVTYMHLDSIDVKVGDIVNAGQKLGISGNTGTRTTGEHLHFAITEIASDGTSKKIDPGFYLADIAKKGNLQQRMLMNGEDYLARYKDGASNVSDIEMASVEKKDDPQNDMYSDLAHVLGTNDPNEIMKYLFLKNEGLSIGNGDLLGEIAGMFLQGFAELYSFYMTSKNTENEVKEEKQSLIKEVSAERMVTRQRESIDIKEVKNLMAMNFDNYSPEEDLGRGKYIS